MSVKELVSGVFVSPHSFCNSFNFLSGSRVRARIGLHSVHSVILLLLGENGKQARRADKTIGRGETSCNPCYVT